MHAISYIKLLTNFTQTLFHNTPSLSLGAAILMTSCSTQLLASPVLASPDSYRSQEGLFNEPNLFDMNVEPTVVEGKSTSLLAKTTTTNDLFSSDLNHQLLWNEGNSWINDIGTLLFKDQDHDGYFSGFSLSIDADTDFAQVDVYATIEIQSTLSDPETLHTTNVFSAYGDSSSDIYRIDIELLSSYAIGEYDLSVNLIDAYSDTVLDTLSASDLSNLSRLPLESEEFDNSPSSSHQIAPIQTPDTYNVNIRVEEYSGATSFWSLLLLTLPIAFRSFLNAFLKMEPHPRPSPNPKASSGQHLN